MGLIDFFEESIRRFEAFFGWEEKNYICGDNMLKNPSIDRTPNYVKFEEDSFVWKLLEERNLFDLQLYDFAYKMFIEQGRVT